MNAGEKFLKSFGKHVNLSLGEREGSISPVESGSQQPGPEDGRGRHREAGMMELARIIPDPNQPRQEFDAEALAHLADSIRTRGILQPLRVRWEEALAKWVIVFGERRYRAALAAGLTSVPCTFVDRAPEPMDVLEDQLVENLVREDLKPIEQAKGFRALMDLKGLTMRDVAARLHVSAATVARALALLKLPEDLQHQVDAGELAARAAYEVAKLSDAAAQRQAAEQAKVGGRTVQETTEAVRNSQGSRSRARTTTRTYPVARGRVAITLEGRATVADMAAALRQALEIMAKGRAA